MKLRIVEDPADFVTLESISTPGTGVRLDTNHIVRSREQVELLQRTAAQVLDESNLDWQQSRWATGGDFHLGYCNTAGCFAAHALANAEIPVVLDGEEEGLNPAVEGSCWYSAAQAVLGLYGTEANKLFYGGNTRADIKTNVNRIVARTKYLEDVL